MKNQSNKALERKVKKMEQQIKEIWTVIDQRDNYIFGDLIKEKIKEHIAGRE